MGEKFAVLTEQGCSSMESKGGAVLQLKPTTQLLNQTLQDSIPVTCADSGGGLGGCNPI